MTLLLMMAGLIVFLAVTARGMRAYDDWQHRRMMVRLGMTGHTGWPDRFENDCAD